MKVIVLVLFAFVVLLSLVGCPPKPPVPVPPTPIDAPPDADDTGGRAPATCYDVCKRQAALGCIGAKPTAHGATCMEVCNAVQSSGVVTWNLGCRANAPSCAAADLCEER
jgi:predicted small lipoprotein YifL